MRIGLTTDYLPARSLAQDFAKARLAPLFVPSLCLPLDRHSWKPTRQQTGQHTQTPYKTLWNNIRLPTFRKPSTTNNYSAGHRDNGMLSLRPQLAGEGGVCDDQINMA